MRVCWSIHSRDGRRPRVAILETAHGDSRTFERLAQGQANVHVARNDVQVSIDTTRLDHLLVCESDRYATWAGPITALREDLSGIISLTAEGMAVLLDGEPMPQAENYTSSIGSGAILQSVLRNSNRGQHSGIYPGHIAAGPSLSFFALGGQTGLQALAELADRTGWEWSVRHAVAPSGAQSFLDWRQKQGCNIAPRLHLYEGRDFTELTYGLDLASMVAAVNNLGGTGAVASRTSSSASGNENVLRALRKFRVGTHRRVNQDPTTTDQGNLLRSAQSEQERAVTAAETLTAVVNANSDWHDLEVGNYGTFEFRTTLSGNAARIMRIVGVQPMESEGLCALTLEGVL